MMEINLCWKLWIFFVCFWIICSVATKEKFEDLVMPYNLTISSYNLHANLLWSIKSKHATSSNNYDMETNVTYTVLVKQYIPKKCDFGCWVPMPNCRRIKQQKCQLTNIDMYSNEYQVRAQVGNGTSVASLTKEYDPCIEDQLYPPTFELSFDESDVILQIPHPDRVNWSGGDFLYNVLRDFDLEYEIQYWIMDTELRQRNQHTMKRPADVVKIGFPVERNLSSSVCVRLRLQGRIDFEPGHWSAPVCLSEKQPESNYNFIGKIVAITVGCVSLLVIIAIVVYTVKKKYTKFKTAITPPLPGELEKVVVDLNGDYPEGFAEDYELENPTLYHPHGNNNLIKPQSVSLLTGAIDKPHYTITNNNYITNHPDGMPKYRPSVLIPPDLEEISDYVGVPSPDSGLGMRMEFDVLN